MTQVLTVSCKLKVSQSQAAKLDATLAAFGQALNWVNQNTPEKVVNAVKLQSLCYRQIRARFGLSSNLAQQQSADGWPVPVKLPDRKTVRSKRSREALRPTMPVSFRFARKTGRCR
jgi:hypothetical protein